MPISRVNRQSSDIFQTVRSGSVGHGGLKSARDIKSDQSSGSILRTLLGRRLGCFFATLVFLLNWVPASEGQSLDKAVLNRAEDATVFIKVKVSGQLLGTGSGFLMRNMGDTSLIMTNRHVAVPDEDHVPPGAKPEIFVVFRSGTPQQQEVPAKLVSYGELEVRDMAVLEVKGVRQVPAPISVDMMVGENEMFRTMSCYSLGFPLGGNMIGDRNANPSVTVNELKISSFHRNEHQQMIHIQMTGALIQGNSGGPIIDARGRLLGIVVQRIRGENVGMAIPPNVINDFLGGDVGEVTHAELLGSIGPATQFKIQLRMIDPLNKIKTVSIRHCKQSEMPTAMTPDSRGVYGIMVPGTTVALMNSNGQASGTFSIPLSTPEDRKIIFQLLGSDFTGRVYKTSKPISFTLPDRLGVINGLDAVTRPAVLAKWSCETNLGTGIKMSHKPGATTIDLPAGLPVNNAPQYDLFNAPCALVKVDGDFVVSVAVDPTFDPGGEGVVVPSGKKLPFSFQSAGILVWQDEKNFVRLERSKGSDGKISMFNRVLVEVYKNGREAAVHYIDVPETKVAMALVRKGGSIQMLFALPPKQLAVFQEMAVDFKKEVFVGLAAANLSKRSFQARFEEFQLRSLDGQDIVPKPFKMEKLVDSGVVVLPDGTRVYEGAALKILTPNDAPVVPQSMADIKGEWTDNRQLLWNNDKAGQALTLELPVDVEGKYEIKGKFTLAPDYSVAKLEIDGRPLYNGNRIDFYSKDIKPTSLMPLGTFTLDKGKRKLKITVFNKNPKSSGFHFGLDEIQLIPKK